MKDKIIEVLRSHPKGLKAREISSHIPNTDRKSINQILYANKDCFCVSADYVWTLASKEGVVQPEIKPENKMNGSYFSERDKALFRERWKREREREERLRQSHQRRQAQQAKEAAERLKSIPMEIGKKCTGNCSTCTREECIDQ